MFSIVYAYIITLNIGLPNIPSYQRCQCSAMFRIVTCSKLFKVVLVFSNRNWISEYCTQETTVFPRFRRPGCQIAFYLNEMVSVQGVAGGHATSVIQFQAGGDERGCGGRDMYLRLQPLYLNNLATGLNWPTVAAWMNFGIRSEFTPKTKPKTKMQHHFRP